MRNLKIRFYGNDPIYILEFHPKNGLFHYNDGKSKENTFGFFTITVDLHSKLLDFMQYLDKYYPLNDEDKETFSLEE